MKKLSYGVTIQWNSEIDIASGKIKLNPSIGSVPPLNSAPAACHSKSIGLEGMGATNRMLIAHPPPIPRHIAYPQRNPPASQGGAHIASRIRHVGPNRPKRHNTHICFSGPANGYCLWGRYDKKRKNTIQGTTNTAQIFALKYLSHVSDKRPSGKRAVRENTGNSEARKTRIRIHGKWKMENWDRCGRTGIFICPGSLSTQFDLISVRIIYLPVFFSLAAIKAKWSPQKFRRNEIWILNSAW